MVSYACTSTRHAQYPPVQLSHWCIVPSFARVHAIMTDPNAVCDAFCDHYYRTIDSQPAHLASLFQPNSMMTFEGNQMLGGQTIVEKIQSYGPLRHAVKTKDPQPGPGGGVFCVVTGAITIGTDNPLHFSQSFLLLPGDSAGNYYVSNTVFRLNYGL